MLLDAVLFARVPACLSRWRCLLLLLVLTDHFLDEWDNNKWPHRDALDPVFLGVTNGKLQLGRSDCTKRQFDLTALQFGVKRALARAREGQRSGSSPLSLFGWDCRNCEDRAALHEHVRDCFHLSPQNSIRQNPPASQ